MHQPDMPQGTAGNRSSDKPPFEHPRFRPMRQEDKLEEGKSILTFIRPKPKPDVARPAEPS